MNTRVLAVKAGDGAVIQAVYYTDDAAEERAKGAVIVVHGFGEHSGSYAEPIQRLTQAGYACAIYNQRGHGTAAPPPGSKVKDARGVAPGYKSLLDDVGAVAAAIGTTLPDAAIALYGHSMGGNIVLNHLLSEGRPAYKCVVLESPWLGLHNEVSPLVAGAAAVLGAISPEIAIFNKLPREDITGDNQKAEAIANDPLYHNRISLRLFTGIRKGCARAIEGAPRLAVPAFLAYAADERIVSNRAILKFHSACGPNVQIKEYESCHAIHNDARRDEFYSDIIEFLGAHM